MVRLSREVTSLGCFLLCHRDRDGTGLSSRDYGIKNSAPFPPTNTGIMLLLRQMEAAVLISKADFSCALVFLYFSCEDAPESVPHTDKNTSYCTDNSYFIAAYGRCTMVSICRCVSLVI